MIQNRIEKSIHHERIMNYVFVYAIGFIELILFGSLVFVACRLIKLDLCNDTNIHLLYNLIALGLMLLWIGVLVGYYAWAIYFYNINLGLTNQDWAEIRERKQYVPEGTVEAPTDNPNAAQTLGLPPGTIRGTIALTLLVSGIAMAIASLGLDQTVKANSILVDNLDFFKTAFLMMIAFYFGNKALETIGYGKQKTPSAEPTANPTKVDNQSAPTSPVVQTATENKNTLNQGGQNDTAVSSSTDDDDDFHNSSAIQ